MHALVLVAVGIWSFLTALAGGLVGLVLGNIRLPAIVFALVLSAGQTVTKNGQPVPNKTVATIVSGAPAAKVLRPGDQIVSVDGVSSSPDSAMNRTLKYHGTAAPATADAP